MIASLARRIPLLSQLEGYDRESFRSDVVAGITTAIMLVPQGMAYAMLAGLDPIVGLYASTVPIALYALLGSSRQLAVGPVAMVSLLVASGVAGLAGGDPARYAALASALALLVGAIHWGMGMARLGFLVKFLSHPVLAGFTAASALIIALSQVKHLLGIPGERTHDVIALVRGTVEHAAQTNPYTLVLSVAAVATLVGLKRFAPRFPRFLLVVAGGSLAVWALDLDAQGVRVLGEVPRGLPAPRLPDLTPRQLVELLPMGLTIALVSFMESISVARNLARATRTSLDPDRELRAMGIANLAGSFFQAYPVAGGFGRSAVHAQAGARTQVAGLVTAAAVAIVLLWLTPLFQFLPNAVLAAIILVAVLGLIDVAEARHLWRVSRPDLGLMATTFAATLAVGIEQGIAIGVAASLLWFVWKTSRPHVAVLGRVPGSTIYRNVDRYPEAEQLPGVVAIRVDGPLYFANTAFLEQVVFGAIGPDTTHLVVDCKAISTVDAQALDAIEGIVEKLRDRKITLWVAGVRGPVRDALAAAHLTERIGADHFVERVHQAFDAIRPPLAQRARAS